MSIDYILIPHLAINLLIAVLYVVIIPVNDPALDKNKLLFILCFVGFELMVFALIAKIFNHE